MTLYRDMGRAALDAAYNNEYINRHAGVLHWNGEQILDWYLNAKAGSAA